ncbi:acetyltransferase [Clostridium sp. CS001]|uniref:acetyltransferase n=1 Tax=Clostridium sp. CS001 TaxID=2880648 RepID=UPI001CF0D5DB|nr:acetyltransferase [Clostridium sp. CS001]MCB2291689.1 acetyltransferase [Clostridium sp. CS001]
MLNIIVVGSSGHAKVIIDSIEKENKYEIIGLLDRFKKVGSSAFGYKILGKEEDLETLIKMYKIQGGIIAIGDNFIRYTVYNKISQAIPEFNFIKVIHPSSQIARNAVIGKGTVIMANSVISSDATVGDFCVINHNSSLDHDSKMSDYSSLGPGSSIGGNSKIGLFTAISLGSKVIHGITIGEHTIIGAGSTVIKDIPEYSIAYGTPAKVIRPRVAGEKYL